MPLLILVLILAVPYLEFLVFLEVGEAIGGLNALIATLLTAVLGVYLIRLEGFEVMRRMHDNLQRGESPVEEIFHSFFLLIAGFFFLLPGFITDTAAVFLSISPIRTLLGRYLLRHVKLRFYGRQTDPFDHPGPTIDGEYREEKDTPPPSLDPWHKKEDDEERK